MLETLGVTELQVEGHAFEGLVVALDLASQVAGHERERQVVVGVVVVEAQIYGQGPRGVLLVGGVDDLGVDAAAQRGGDVVRVDAVEYDVFGRKLAGDDARLVGTLHLAVAVVLDAGRPGAAFAGRLAEGDPGQVDAAHILHVVEPQLQVRFGPQQGGVLVDEVDVFVDNRYVGAAQRVGVGRGGDVEEVERACPLLSPPGQADDQCQQYRYVSKRVSHNSFRRAKIVKGESRGKRKNLFFEFDQSGPPSISCKGIRGKRFPTV